MVSEGELLAQGYHDDQQRVKSELRAELARYKYALAKCLVAMHEDALESDGYSQREIEACELAAPLVGIEWSQRLDAFGDPIYIMKPRAAERLLELEADPR